MNCEGSEILTYLQTSDLAYHNFICICSRLKKTQNSLIQRQRLYITHGRSSSQRSILCQFPNLQSPKGNTVRARQYLYMQWGSLYTRNHKIWKLWSYTWLLPILTTREREMRERGLIFTLECKQVLSGEAKETPLSLLPQTVFMKGDLCKVYYPGVFPYTNTFNLVVNAFTQRTWTVQKHEIFKENVSPKIRLCLLKSAQSIYI